ncbi:hypothetical protein BG842_24310 [Haladaptatus sp. W1]|nr:hypothetical protein BG842_24310 [Haladaptatus sp. W1]
MVWASGAVMRTVWPVVWMVGPVVTVLVVPPVVVPAPMVADMAENGHWILGQVSYLSARCHSCSESQHDQDSDAYYTQSQ